MTIIMVPMTVEIATNIILHFHIHYVTDFFIANNEINIVSILWRIHGSSKKLPKIIRQENYRNNNYLILTISHG